MDVAPEEHSAQYKIFHYYIDCMIPASYAGMKEQKVLGTPIKSKEETEADAKTFWPRQHTVAEMIEYRAMGAEIILAKPEDSVKIYQWLRDYLTEKRAKISYSLHVGTVPLEDLSKMDEFAQIVYRIARRYEDIDNTESQPNRMMQQLYKRRMLRGRTSEEENENNPNEERPIREHRPITKDIAESIAARGLRHK